MVLQILYPKRNPFTNTNDTQYTHLTNDLKVKPKKIKEIILEKLELFSGYENIESKYYTNEKFKENDFDKHNNQTSLLHLNISSLPYPIDDFI